MTDDPDMFGNTYDLHIDQVCPRCGEVALLVAGSRIAVERDIHICDACGRDEALRDFARQPPVPPAEWPTERGDWERLGVD
jgi:hypothetical protein